MTVASDQVLVPLQVRREPAAAPVRERPAVPADGLAATLAAVAAEALGHDHVGPDADFFDDLGADSLSMARFCARLRKRPGMPSVAIRDVYRHRTVGELAAALAGAASSAAPLAAVDLDAPTVRLAPVATAHADRGRRGGRGWRHVGFGVAQVLVFLGWSSLVAVYLTRAFTWLSAASAVGALVERALVVTGGGFAITALLPVVAKWMLVGRWTPRRIPLWGPGHLRFWLVKTLVRTSPMVLFVGSPLYVLYLRALGARIGRGVVILSDRVPVCTDLISVGDGSVIRKDCRFAGYRALPGHLDVGPVTVGRDVVVGETSVLDVRTALGDGATLAHASALHAGQEVPAGATAHGSPAEATDAGYRRVGTRRCGRVRRAVWSLLEVTLLLAVLTAVASGAVLLLRDVPLVARLLEPGADALRDPSLLLTVAALPAGLYLAALVAGLVVTTALPRLLARAVPPDRDHRLYGLRHLAHRAVVLFGNAPSLVGLFGDSSAAPHWLAAVGWRLRPLVQTGTNFGMVAKQETPGLSEVGPGTVIADGLSMMNAEYSATAFRVSRARIGSRNFVGNLVAYPAGGRTGDDCLLATKVMVPIDGPVRSGTGLLGSPAFAIPRTVARDSALDVTDPAARSAAIRAKRRHNVVTMVLHVAVRLVHAVLATVLVALVAVLPVRWGAGELVLLEAAEILLAVAWCVLVERCVVALALRTPDGCSIYTRDFWRHERYWKVPNQVWTAPFAGTPLKPVMWRLLGVRVGARVLDDGAYISERPFTTIGDDTVLGEGVTVQGHSQEDGGFKSDAITVGARCAAAPGTFVHYGTDIGDDALLEADTFLMKGEEVPAGARWGGNPARELPATASTSGAARTGRA